MDIGAWLRGLGLGRYEQAFRDNDVDLGLLPELTADDLIGLGVASIGHRRKLLAAIAALPARAGPAPPAVPGPRSHGAERRQLTVMFVDLVGSTALATRLDPEDMQALLRAYQEAVAGSVTRFGGHVVKLMGDGVLACFGWPRAHEDAAERAARAALAIVEAVGRVPSRGVAPLAVRVGIATGLVLVGELIGKGPAQEEALVGETPNLAARLQGLAEPGTVVVAESTRRLLAGLFEMRDLGERPLRGFGQPVRAWRLLAPTMAESRFEARHADGLVPLVGRERELALLLDRWALAKAGQGQVVLLSGEPGIGKSRIAMALRERLRAERQVSLRYQCSPYHSRTALWPVIEHLERAAGFARGDDAAAKAAKLGALFREAAARVPDTLPLVADLLSVPLAGRSAPRALPPQQRKARTFAALLAQLEAVAAEQPVLMVLEDAQWVDPTTLELFEQTVERIRHLPVLLVATFRPGRALPWAGQAHATLLRLGRLGAREAAAMVARIAGKALPAEVMGQILAKADGVPLFVEELTKAVLELGFLRDEGGRYALQEPLPPLAIPDTLQGSLLARLDRLAPVKEVAQIGAVIGRTFPRDLLARVALLPEAELQRWLDRLVAAGLLHRTVSLGCEAYAFKHALVRDAAYDSLLKSRRRQLHARIARELEQAFPLLAAEEPELLAHHYTEARLADRAIGYWRRAGERAVQRYANAEAIGHFRRALGLLADLPAGPERDRTELLLQKGLGVALMAGKGYSVPEVQEAYARARELCRDPDDRAALFPILLGSCLFYCVKSELPAARSLAAQCLAVAREARDDDLLLEACGVAGTVELYPGKLVAARVLLERGLALYRSGCHGDHAARYGQDPLATLAFVARVHALLGYPDTARQRGQALLALTRQPTVQPNSLAAVHAHLAHLHLVLRAAPEALRHADATIAVASQQDLPLWLGLGRMYRGAALVEDALRGSAWPRAGEGIAEGLEGLAAYRATGAGLDAPTCLCWLAAGHAGLGRPTAALRLLDEAWRAVARTGEAYFAAELHRAKGMALLRSAGPDRAEAEACFRAAMATARAQSARMWELRGATALARLWAEQGERRRAYDMLAPIYGWFREGFDMPDLQEAEALLDELR